MRSFALAALLLSWMIAGCGVGPAPVTDPSKLTPLSAEQIKEARKQDDDLADDEHGTPIPAKVKGRMAGRK